MMARRHPLGVDMANIGIDVIADWPYVLFVNPSTTPKSSVPAAPHPFTPAGILGRNSSYSPNARTASSSGLKFAANFVIAFITAGMLALAFMGFAGLVPH